ncbi:hypothetical protein Cyrtocomes_00340 [Candidatus Cyrtobacter comes]|uniref:Uncharacterized protein n=1 Tax=Candidatus Cyrtobacter comes TaxID=675776 RepID=A0ABU5L7U7_9RICK|nr:hypothetical protein [Candidatus Cyrtobacter comes]MDZ5761975.1 hypothetical protein [Candidatus Cyrtobacter comes]
MLNFNSKVTTLLALILFAYMLYTEHYGKSDIPSDTYEWGGMSNNKKLNAKYKVEFPRDKDRLEYNPLEKILFFFYGDKIK